MGLIHIGLMVKSIGSCYGGALQGTVASLTGGEGASATEIFAATSLAGQVAGITGTFIFTKLYAVGLEMRSTFGNALPFVVASVSRPYEYLNLSGYTNVPDVKAALTLVIISTE